MESGEAAQAAKRDAAYFDQWYDDMATSPARDAIVARTLGLPPELQSNSLLTWPGIAEVTEALRMPPGGLLHVRLAAPRVRDRHRTLSPQPMPACGPVTDPVHVDMLSRRCRSSWAASSISLCRHSAARYWQAMMPMRWTRRKSP